MYDPIENCKLWTKKCLIFNEKIFFQEYIEMELKSFFIIFEGFFAWQKQSIAIVILKQFST